MAILKKTMHAHTRLELGKALALFEDHFFRQADF